MALQPVLFELYSHPDAEPCMVLGHKNYILMFPRDQPWTVEEGKKESPGLTQHLTEQRHRKSRIVWNPVFLLVASDF